MIFCYDLIDVAIGYSIVS